MFWFYFFRPAAECLQKINNLRSLDICVSVFSHQRAAELVAAQSGRMVCDVLLDQLILPGVGNIIKNEVVLHIHDSMNEVIQYIHH